MPVGRKYQLLRRWSDLWNEIGVPPDRQPSSGPLLAAYAGRDRFYHNLAHLAQCLDHLARVRPQLQDPWAVEAALWFHDFVYDPGRKDNEQRSAEEAVRTITPLLDDLEQAERVRALILATRHDREPQTSDQQYIMDIDLAILGASAGKYDAYERAIRREYAHVPDEVFRTRRADLLRRFLDRPHIYFTPSFQAAYEDLARANLKRALNRLQKPRPNQRAGDSMNPLAKSYPDADTASPPSRPGQRIPRSSALEPDRPPAPWWPPLR